MSIQTLHDTHPWEWPENAAEVIFEVLRDKGASASDRVMAAELAGNIVAMNDNLAGFLLAVIRDSDEPEELRCQAPISLGPALEYVDMVEFDDPEDVVLSEKVFSEVRERLRTIYHDTDIPKLVRRRVLEGSVRSPMDWHKDAIQAAYSNDDEDWILTAVFCMNYVKGFEAQVLESLDNKHPDIFYEAVCAAGAWGIKEAWPYVKELLTKPGTDKWLLIAAIEGAANINPDEAIDMLMDFSDSEDEDIADAAEEALAMAGAGLDDDDEVFEDDFY